MVNKASFDKIVDGKQVGLFTLKNQNGMYADITNYGAKIVTLFAPDKDDKLADVVLGFETLDEWIEKETYFNTIVGRFANRIKDGKFTLDGKQYQLAINNGTNHLHGGNIGFNQKVWDVLEVSETSLKLQYISADGEENYPGTLTTVVTYAITEDNALSIHYEATTDKPTIAGFTNHAYFNLSGHQSGPVTGQFIQLHAARYTPARPGSIPTGETAPVEGTPMDLRQPQPIGAHIDDPFPQLELARGYDHNWVVDGEAGTLRPAANAWSEKTGICLEVLTTMPGVQFYTGNFLEGCPPGKGGTVYGNRWAFCLETQYFPDAPNCPQFPSPVLRAGEIYHHETVYRLSCAE